MKTHKRDKWFSIYVPESESGNTLETYESYFRMGSPNRSAERAFVNSLKASYHNDAANPAVQAAFTHTPTGGMVVYTDGDLVQFVNGTSDTRVLNDSFIVHVLDKADVEAAADPTLAVPPTTYRSYLRLGKPHDDIELPLQGIIPDADLQRLIRALAPACLQPIDTTTQLQLLTAALGGPVPPTGQDPDDAAVSVVRTARNQLTSLAEAGDPLAISAIDQLRTSKDAKAAVEYDQTDANDWALAELQGLHLTLANMRRDDALMGNVDARDKLAAAAKGNTTAPGDPLARRKLLELTTSVNPNAATSQNNQTPAHDWATAVLASVPPDPELNARWSLGNGIALYSDNPITVSTPAALAITAGSDSRSVLGQSYSETYEVSDDVVAKIVDGTINNANQVPGKHLVNAALTAKSWAGDWMSSSYDSSKTVAFALGASGNFQLELNYNCTSGLTMWTGVGGVLNALLGVNVTMSNNLLNVELGNERFETTWLGGKAVYDKAQSLTGESVTLGVGKVEDYVTASLSKALMTFTRIALGVINGAVLAYTISAAGVASIKTTGVGDDSTPGMENFLKSSEPLFEIIAGVNAALMAAGLVVGMVHLATKATVGPGEAALPAQKPNIVINDAGITLQCGASYISLDDTGVAIYGPQVYLAGPMTNVLPEYLTANLTPAKIAELVEEAAFIEALMNIDI